MEESLEKQEQATSSEPGKITEQIESVGSAPTTDHMEKIGGNTMDESVSLEQPNENEPPAIEGSSSTKIAYTLRFTGWPTLQQLVTVAVAVAAYTVLSFVSLGAVPNPATAVAPIFIAIGFGVPFAIWFGGWAFVIAYIGNFVGAGLLSVPPLPLPVALAFGTTDLIQLGLPMLLYRFLAPRFGVSSIGKDVYTVRGFIFFLLCAVIPNNLIGAFYGNIILVWGGINPPNLYLPSVLVWFISNIIFTALIGSILLKTVGPLVERFGLTIRNALR